MLLLLANLTVFSQATILDSTAVKNVRTLKIGNDTIIGFTVPQSKYLLKEHYRAEKLDTLNRICEQQKTECDSLRKDNLQEISNFQMVISNQNKMFALKEEELKKTELSLADTHKELRKQKMQKLITIGAALAETIFFVKYISEHH